MEAGVEILERTVQLVKGTSKNTILTGNGNEISMVSGSKKSQ